MKKVLNYALAYILWIIDLGLALWLFFYGRTAFLSIYTFFFNPANWHNAQMMNAIDKALVVLLGLGWLIFMIVVEEYFRIGVSRGELPKRIARVTGPLLLTIFIVELVLLWLTGTAGINILRWLIMLIELSAGIILIVLAKTRLASSTN